MVVTRVTRLQGLKKRFRIKEIRIKLDRLEHANLQKRQNRGARQTKTRNRKNIRNRISSSKSGQTRQELEEAASVDSLAPLTTVVVADKPNQKEFLAELLERSA